MTPQEQRNEQLAQTIIKNLKRRHMEGFYCATAEEAVKKVSELIADGSSVTWGGTMTVRDMGIPQFLKDRGTLQLLDRDLAATPEETQAIYLKAFSSDVYLSSANAISEDGVIVNIDGNGNRVAASISGPKRVVYVIGRNKVVEGGVDAAIERIKSKACPPNAARLGLRTPCGVSGRCVGGAGCDSPSRMCKVTAVFDRKPTGVSAKVILVDEDLGY